MTVDLTLIQSVRSSVERAGFVVSDRQCAQLVRYIELLERWNRTINLTALPLAGFPERSLDRLLGEPLAAAPLAPFEGTWFDLGSGGGSPAIPLKIVRPGLSLTLVESRERKCAFLREVVRELSLDRATVVTERIEKLPEMSPAPAADLVSARAVRVEEGLLTSVRSILRPGGRFLLFSSRAQPVPDLQGFALGEEHDVKELGTIVMSFVRQ